MEYRILNKNEKIMQNTSGCFADNRNEIPNPKSQILYSTHRGYTLIELLIVLAIIGIIMAITIPSFSKFRQNSALNIDTMNVITLMNRARLLSISEKADTQYGIHLETNKAVLYQEQGTGYDASAPANETYTLSSGIALTGTASEILFAKVTGAASTVATTTLTVTGTTSSTTVLIYLTGISTIQ